MNPKATVGRYIKYSFLEGSSAVIVTVLRMMNWATTQRQKPDQRRNLYLFKQTTLRPAQLTETMRGIKLLAAQSSLLVSGSSEHPFNIKMEVNTIKLKNQR